MTPILQPYSSLSLHQVADYSIEFRILAADSGWNEVSLQSAFIQGLSEEIKYGLAAKDETESLESLISFSIRLGNRMQRWEKSGSHRSFSSRPLPESCLHSPPDSLTASAPPSVRAPPTGLEEPMQLGRAHLTPAKQQQHLKASLCGQSGHFLSSSPNMSKDRAHQ